MKNELDYNFINVEGGPIIFGSSERLSFWNGIEGNDYSVLCKKFDESENELLLNSSFEGGMVNSWEVRGPGVVYIDKSDNRIQLVKHWISESADSSKTISDSFSKSFQCTVSQDSEIEIRETLIVAWAPECLRGVPVSVDAPTTPDLDLAVDQSVLLIPIKSGRYSVETGELSDESGFAIKLILNRL